MGGLIKVILFSVICGGLPRFVWAGFGASSTFAKVNIGSIESGRVVRLSSLGQLLTVTNTSDIPVTLSLRLSRPPEKEVDGGFEPVPSVTWAVLEKNEFKLAPGESVSTDVILKPSLEEKYREKNFQLHIFSRVVGAGNVRIILVHKVQFTVAKETTVSSRDILKESKFKINPSFFEVNNVDLGRLSTNPLRRLVVQNTDHNPHRYRVRTLNPEASAEFDGRSSRVVPPSIQQNKTKGGFVLQPGESRTLNSSNGMTVVFDSLLPRNWVSVGVTEFTLEPGEKRILPINIFLPPYDPLKNQKFIPIVRVTQLDGGFPTTLIPVYLTTSNQSFQDSAPAEFEKQIFADVRVEMVQ